jgi:hypothetical protein
MSTKSLLDSNAQLIFFKEEILKDIRRFESKLTLKYNAELNKNTSKILKMQESLDEMNKKIESFTSLIKTDLEMEKRTNNLSTLYSTLEQEMLSQDIKLKNINNLLNETITKFNDEFYMSIIYPGVIGPTGKYKTFHEFIDFVLLNINNLLLNKDKFSNEFKEYKSKTDVSINNLMSKLDYTKKNCNAFTSASIREHEKKIGEKLNELIKNGLDNINKKFEGLSESQDKKIKALEENIKIIGDNGNIKGIFLKKENKNDIMNNNNNTQSGNKKVSSIVKKYIEGKLKNDELLFKRRKSSENFVYTGLSPKNNLEQNLKLFRENKFNKIFKKQNSFKSEAKSESLNNSEYSFNELYENKTKNLLKNNIIKSKIKERNNDKGNYILNYLHKLYQDSDNSNKSEEKKINSKNKNNPINENLYITNNTKKENETLFNSNRSRRLSIQKIEEINTNNKEKNDIKDFINKMKQNNCENILPNKMINKNEILNNINNNKTIEPKIINLNQISLKSLTFKQNSRNNNNLFNSSLNFYNGKKSSKKLDVNNFSYNKQNHMNKTELKKVDLSSTLFRDNSKEKDEQKMKKIFNQIEDVIQEDEKLTIKNRFLKYGYSKDIIFAKSKKKYK